MKLLAAAVAAATLMGPVGASTPALSFSGLLQAAAPGHFQMTLFLYQVFPDGQVIFIGERVIALPFDLREALPGIEEMHCQLYVRDYTGYSRDGHPNGLPNGIFEAPGIMSCLDATGAQHVVQLELDIMENQSETT
jgi:hypothetical protein